MNVQECKAVIAYIASAYPRFYSNISRVELEQQARVWTDVLNEYTREEVQLGAQGYISADSSGFPPTPGQIVAYMHKIMHPTDTYGPEAWALVRKAVRYSGWDATAAYATLPPLVQRAVGSADSLRAMARMDIDALETVAQSNFLRTYEAMLRREAIEQKLPRRSRMMIDSKKPQAMIPDKVQKPMEETRGHGVPAPTGMMEKLRERLGR